MPAESFHERAQILCSGLRALHTLGPEGTNCEKAAKDWLIRQGQKPTVYLHKTLEVAVELALEQDTDVGVLGCVVYPELHHLVFSNLNRLMLVDCFVMPTYEMVLASRQDVTSAKSIATHPAPSRLVPSSIPEIVYVTSNSQAAIDCASGRFDACITTSLSAEDHGLVVLKDFGQVPMGFTVHARV